MEDCIESDYGPIKREYYKNGKEKPVSLAVLRAMRAQKECDDGVKTVIEAKFNDKPSKTVHDTGSGTSLLF